MDDKTVEAMINRLRNAATPEGDPNLPDEAAELLAAMRAEWDAYKDSCEAKADRIDRLGEQVVALRAERDALKAALTASMSKEWKVITAKYVATWGCIVCSQVWAVNGPGWQCWLWLGAALVFAALDGRSAARTARSG